MQTVAAVTEPTIDMLADITLKVKAADVELRMIGRKTTEKMCEIGDLLRRAKSLLPHGKFQKWLKEHGIAEESARCYRRLAEFAEKNPQSGVLSRPPHEALVMCGAVTPKSEAKKESSEKPEAAMSLPRFVRQHFLESADEIPEAELAKLPQSALVLLVKRAEALLRAVAKLPTPVSAK